MLIGRIKYYLFKRKYRKINAHNETIPGNQFSLEHVIAGKKTYGIITVSDSSDKDNKLIIGSYCSIASGVVFLLGGEHQIDAVSTFPLRLNVSGIRKKQIQKVILLLKMMCGLEQMQ